MYLQAVRTATLVHLFLSFSDYEHVPLNGIITKNLLESHIKTHRVLLTGQVNSMHLVVPLSTLSPSPAPKYPCSPQSPVAEMVSSHTRQYSAESPANMILPIQSVTFIDTVVKEFKGT